MAIDLFSITKQNFIFFSPKRLVGIVATLSLFFTDQLWNIFIIKNIFSRLYGAGFIFNPGGGYRR